MIDAIRRTDNEIARLVGEHVLADRQIRRHRRLQHRDRLIDPVEQIAEKLQCLGKYDTILGFVHAKTVR